MSKKQLDVFNDSGFDGWGVMYTGGAYFKRGRTVEDLKDELAFLKTNSPPGQARLAGFVHYAHTAIRGGQGAFGLGCRAGYAVALQHPGHGPGERNRRAQGVRDQLE